jgi:hypothetical protein
MDTSPRKAKRGCLMAESAEQTIERLLQRRAEAEGADSAMDIAVLTIAGATRFLTSTLGRAEGREAIREITDILDVVHAFQEIERTGVRQ